MKWLVTLDQNADRKQAIERLKSLQCELPTPERSVSLGSDELVIAVEGPANLAQLAEPYSATMKVYPNSKMRAF